jgi:hypothetical protein
MVGTKLRRERSIGDGVFAVITVSPEWASQGDH